MNYDNIAMRIASPIAEQEIKTWLSALITSLKKHAKTVIVSGDKVEIHGLKGFDGTGDVVVSGVAHLASGRHGGDTIKAVVDGKTFSFKVAEGSDVVPDVDDGDVVEWLRDLVHGEISIAANKDNTMNAEKIASRIAGVDNSTVVKEWSGNFVREVKKHAKSVQVAGDKIEIKGLKADMSHGEMDVTISHISRLGKDRDASVSLDFHENGKTVEHLVYGVGSMTKGELTLEEPVKMVEWLRSSVDGLSASFDPSKVSSELVRVATELVRVASGSGLDMSDLNVEEKGIVNSGVLGWGLLSLEALWDAGITIAKHGHGNSQLDKHAMDILGDDEFNRAKSKGVVFIKKSKTASDEGHYHNECPNCGNINQCRCPQRFHDQFGVNKTNDLCSECKDANTASDAEPMQVEDRMLSVAEVQKHCPSCADAMVAKNLRGIRASVLSKKLGKQIV